MQSVAVHLLLLTIDTIVSSTLQFHKHNNIIIINFCVILLS